MADIVALSFFSGALGLDLGMELSGIRTALYCESDKACRDTIAANRPDVPLVGDICDITAADVRRCAGIGPHGVVDVMFGGPPCQAFSTAGARRAFADVRGNVFLRYLDLADELEPTYLVIENVRGLLSARWPLEAGGEPVRGGAMAHVLKRLGEQGRSVTFELYNAANFGAAQIRERVVLVAKLGDKVAKLTPTNSDDVSWGLPGWVTFADVTCGIASCTHAEFPHARAKYLDMLAEGQCWRDLPEDVQRQAMGKSFSLGGGRTGFYRRIRSDRPCPTLVTSPIMPATCLCHPTETRPLSVEEYMRVQGFPDCWHVAGKLMDKYRQLGNAVPVALGRAIGQTILDDMAGRVPDAKWSTFKHSRYRNTDDAMWSCG